MRPFTAREWAAELAQLARTAAAQHGPVAVGAYDITPVTGQPYGVTADAPATITRLQITGPYWTGWRDSWRQAYTLARHLARQAANPQWIAAYREYQRGERETMSLAPVTP